MFFLTCQCVVWRSCSLSVPMAQQNCTPHIILSTIYFLREKIKLLFQGCVTITSVVVVVVAEHLYSAPGVMEPQKRSWLAHKVCFQILLKSLQTNIQVPHIRWKSVPKTRPRYRETSIAVALESPGRTDEISSSS